MVKNMSRLEDPDRYYNWYYGYTKISYPHFSPTNELWYRVETSATSGNLSTKYFEDQFDVEKVDLGQFLFQIIIHVPLRVAPDITTMIVSLNRTRMEDTDEHIDMTGVGRLNEETRNFNKNYT